MGLTWAVAWSGFGAIWGLVAGGGFAGLAWNAAFFALVGFVGGTAFSGVLGIAGRRRTFDQMSLPRFTAWGAAAGLLLTALMLSTTGTFTLALLLEVGVTLTLLGAGSAAGSLALARRAEDRELLEAGEEALGLTEGG